MRPKKAKAVISALLAKLSGLHSRRRGLLDDPLSAWRHLQAVDQQVADAMSSASWITGDAVGFVEAHFATEHDPDDHFASVLVTLRSGDAEPVFGLLARGSPSPDYNPARVLMALRLCPGDSFLAKLKTLFVASSGKMRTGMLSVLADCGELSTDWLLSALDEPDDDVATRAAEVVAWLGRSPEDARAVEGRALRDVPANRRQALLYAAVALGSERALLDIRDLLDSGAAIAPRTIDALVVGGGPNDVPRLLEVATRQPELAALAILAVGHLGDPDRASAISSATVSDEVKDRALRAILGDSPSTPPPKNVGRRLYGEPWTVSGALARLIAPDELLPTRTWHALEIGVRLGVRPQAFFDPEASSEHQAAAIERIRIAAGGSRQTKGSGQWLFFGQPIR